MLYLVESRKLGHSKAVPDENVIKWRVESRKLRSVLKNTVGAILDAAKSRPVLLRRANAYLPVRLQLPLEVKARAIVPIVSA